MAVESTTAAIRSHFTWKTLAIDLDIFLKACLHSRATLGVVIEPRPFGSSVHGETRTIFFNLIIWLCLLVTWICNTYYYCEMNSLNFVRYFLSAAPLLKYGRSAPRVVFIVSIAKEAHVRSSHTFQKRDCPPSDVLKVPYRFILPHLPCICDSGSFFVRCWSDLRGTTGGIRWLWKEVFVFIHGPFVLFTYWFWS